MSRFCKVLAGLMAAAFMFPACQEPAVDYVEWLYASMPLPDSLQYPREYWEANVAKTLEVRQAMDWGIPEREFRHFVLPLRVNNEALDDFRTVYADTLCRRVKGLSLGEAALEINTEVDAAAAQGQNQGDADNRSGDDQADPGTVLDFHYCSSSFPVLTFV